MIYKYENLSNEKINNDLKLRKYLDETQLDSLIKNNSEFKLITIGTPSDVYNNNIFNELFILCYKSSDGRLLYKQLKMDTELYNEYKYYQSHSRRGRELADIFNAIDTSNEYDIDNIKYTERLYNSYNNNIGLEFKFNIFNDSKLIDILIYNEDLSLNPDEIV